MDKEIGSIFPLENIFYPPAEPFVTISPSSDVKYSLCREALYDICVNHGGQNKKVLIPAYTCQTVITPFEEAGWTCYYYNVQKDLHIDTDYFNVIGELVKPGIVVVHPYYGLRLNQQESDSLRQIGEKGATIVMDFTQGIFADPEYDFVDFFIGSYRKWFPIPDGAFLKVNKADYLIPIPDDEDTEFVTMQTDAMFLRNQYFNDGVKQLKTISIRLNKRANSSVAHGIKPHRMSSFSLELMQRLSFQEVRSKRQDNFNYLFKHLNQYDGFRFVCPDLSALLTTPLYFAVFSSNRDQLQRVLADNDIYAPVLWPVENQDLLISEDVKYIYEHILAIPCDQRYGEKEMRRIVRVINTFLNERENRSIGSK